MKKNVTLALACCAVLLLLAVCAASAESDFHDCDLGWFDATDPCVMWSIPQFDPALGTLNHVYLFVDAYCAPHVFAEQTGDTAVTDTVYLDWSVELQTPMFMGRIPYTVYASVYQGEITRDYGAFDGTLDYGGSSGWNGVLSGDDREDLTYTYADGLISAEEWDLGWCIGTGYADLYVQWMVGCSSYSDLDTCVEARINPYVYVEYDYTPVPEPSGVLALATGLGGLVGIIARRPRRLS